MTTTHVRRSHAERDRGREGAGRDGAVDVRDEDVIVIGGGP
jgi:hypothetical protein